MKLFDLHFILTGLVLLILVGGLIYTMRIGRVVGARQSEYDTEVHENIRKHHLALNPVFLAYIIGIGLAIVYIIYHAYKFY